MDRASAPDRLRTWMASAVVVVAIAAAHGRAVTADFVAFDDDQYVFQNEHVQRGLAPASFAWAFELDHPRSYFHPLTWLSLMLDRTLLGPGAWGFHLVNVVLHAAVAVLLLLVLARTTGQLWASLGAALLFGVHPLTVEAVAWVSERKTVLSAALGMAAILVYVRHAERPSPRRMATVAALALASLLAKPGLVVLPILLLLLDVWPLRRIGVPPGPRSEPGLARLVVEKWPVALAAAAAVVVSLVSTRGIPTTGAADSMWLRVANAVVSVPRYLGKAAWPADLSVFHLFPEHVPLAEVVASAVAIGALTAIAVVAARRWTFGLVGWAWFLMALGPALGLKQAGLWPAWADRFTYVPLMGLAMTASFAAAALARHGALARRVAVGAVAGIVLAFAGASYAQGAHWKDSIALFSRGAAVEPGSYVMNYGLARALLTAGRVQDAIPPLEAALRIYPTSVSARLTYAKVLARVGRPVEAAAEYDAVRREASGWSDPAPAPAESR
ncbi:MAG TPA: tetratricopeptide repeat protein [Anaeromyxobacter sp.]